ncbi:MAG: T9SS type A sorting domain-containing protein, partial [Bacteroidales bacterium]
ASSTEDHFWTNLRIYPNPAADFVTIESADVSQVLSTIKIYSISGRQVVNHTIERGNRIDISMLQEGIYLVVIRNGDKQAQRKLVIAR